MMNGHTEPMRLSTSERMALGKAGKRTAAQPIGRAAERDFDWKSVQAPELRRDVEFDRGDGGGSAHTPARLFERPEPARPLDRVFSEPKSSRGLSPVVGEAGTLTVHAVEKSFAGRKVVKGVSLSVQRGEAVGLLGPNGAGKTTVFYM